ncbi:protein Tube [Drosophila hydei]|uniref:Protein Tube n=1 Tax=Drosophila hydei TaxID=7224 RepID=A0A6J1M1H8_DROHY|nr:protein Tube [Drosophila hydei]
MEMAKTKANGWATVCTSTSSVPIYSKYTRYTELRRVDDNDIYKLATILDVNSCWRKLMSIIPKRLDAQACSAPGALKYQEIAAKVGLKYTAQQISLIDGTAERLTPGQSISQVMIDEWKTSGKLNERPTVGVLLQLLVQAEIYSAADFVALHFLNEPKPDRPTDGPAAHISLDLCSEDLSEDMEVDDSASYQPNTSTLNAAAAQARGTGMNLDYFDKHMVRRDKSVPQQIENGTSISTSSPVPVAPPRSARLSRHLKTTTSNGATITTTAVSSSSQLNAVNMPNLSILNASSEKLASANVQTQPPQNIPHLSILNGCSEAVTMSTTSTTPLDAGNSDTASNGSSSTSTSTATVPNVPLITLLIENSSCEISGTSDAMTTATSKSTTTKTVPDMSYNNLPAISALNLNTVQPDGNGAKARNDNGDNNSSGTNSLSNDEDDEEDEEDDDDDDDADVDDEEADVSLPNLSNSDHQNSNNDSSLTTVTGTSGDNSFEMTNDSSSASNDDYTNNIPNLSELQQ